MKKRQFELGDLVRRRSLPMSEPGTVADYGLIMPAERSDGERRFCILWIGDWFKEGCGRWQEYTGIDRGQEELDEIVRLAE